MSLQENKALVRRYVDEVQSQHNLAAIDELFSPAFINHDNEADPPGTEGVKRFFTILFDAFPDARFTIHLQLAEGDKVMTYKTLQGTHLGYFMGIPPTGKRVSFSGMDVFTVVHGKLAEHWSVSGMLELMQQLGVVPAPEKSGT